MRTYPQDDFDRRQVALMGAPDWMIEALRLNTECVQRGLHEICMVAEGGRNGQRLFESWDDFDLTAGELNEGIGFYFDVQRAESECEHCQGSGYNTATHQLQTDWYDFAGKGRRWIDKLTQVEVDALWEAGRLRGDFQCKPSAEAVNDWQKGPGLGHGAINRQICVEARARLEGVFGYCPHCQGEGSVFTEERCRLALVLWENHPLQEASREVVVRDIKESQLLEVRAYLRQAAQRNT